MQIGKAIKRAREIRGLTQSKVAELTGTSENYISLLENDHRDPSWSLVCKLAEVFRFPLPYLLLLADMEGSTRLNQLVASTIAEELLSLVDEAAAMTDD